MSPNESRMRPATFCQTVFALSSTSTTSMGVANDTFRQHPSTDCPHVVDNRSCFLNRFLQSGRAVPALRREFTPLKPKPSHLQGPRPARHRVPPLLQRPKATEIKSFSQPFKQLSSEQREALDSTAFFFNCGP